MDEIVNLAGIEALEEAEILEEHDGRAYNQNIDPFYRLSERKFIKIYRLDKATAEHVIDLVSPYMEEQTRRSALSIRSKVLTTLRFMACGSYQMDIGNSIYASMSQASVSNAISEVTSAMNRPEIFNQIVKFPNNVNELTRLRTEFYNEYGFPGVVGCVDCTHVAIVPPNANHALFPEHLYVNRKGYHSINVQLICDVNLKVLNVSARYPGSTHDAFIFSNSNISTCLENLHRNRPNLFYLLGDSGYPLRPWIMTPINQAAPNSPEDNYNIAQRRVRSIIERCNGVLKMRFRCLLKHRVLHYAPEKASKIINSCIMLHNLCLDNNVPLVPLNDEENLDDVDFGMYEDLEPDINIQNNVQNDLLRARQRRQTIVTNYFA